MCGGIHKEECEWGRGGGRGSWNGLGVPQTEGNENPEDLRCLP